VKKISDRVERTRYAHTLVELMKQINPNTRDAQDIQNKLWDDLYILSGFDLDVDSPFPMPGKEIVGKKPQKVNYNMNRLLYRHYGRNVELLIARAFELNDTAEQFRAFVQIARLMKSFYTTWNKDSVMDTVILDHIEDLAKRPIPADVLERIKAENALDGSMKENRKQNFQHHSSNNQNNRNNRNDRNDRNDKRNNSSNNNNNKRRRK
jgi:hypothetical protein